MNFRKILLTLHLIGGLLSALALLALGVTGGLLVFEGEIAHNLDPKLFKVTPTGSRLPLAELTSQAESRHPGSKVTTIVIPREDSIAYTLSLRPPPPAKSVGVTVDPYIGAELGSLDHASQLPKNVHQFHTNLLLGPPGKTITMVSAIFLLALSLSGLILWWPRKLWRFGAGSGGRNVNFELHNVLGLYSSVFMLLFAITGIVIHWDNDLTAYINGRQGIVETPPPKAITPPANAARLDPDALVAAAQAAVPGAHVTTLQGLTGNAPVRVTMKFPEDGTPAGRTNLFVDPFSGKVLSSQDSRTGPIGMRIVKLWNREIHTGDIGGLPTRILASLASFSLPLLAITGPLIWWGRLRRRRKRASAGIAEPIAA